MPNDSNTQNVSKFLVRMQALYNVKDFFYFYMGQKVFLSRQGFSWLDDEKNWKSISTGLLTLYGCYTIFPESSYQFNYNTKYFPNSPIYFLPYSFFTYGLIFTENSNYSKLANNEMTKLFSNGTIVLSYINESVEPEAYSSPSPVGILQENPDTGEFVYYPPQTSTDNSFLWFTNPGFEYAKIEYGNVFDQLIIFPYLGQNMDVISYRFETLSTLRYFLPFERFGPISGNFKFFLVTLLRASMKQEATPIINFAGDIVGITNIFAALNPIAGNSNLSPYPLMENIPGIKIYRSQLLNGTIHLGIVTPATRSFYYHYVSQYQNTSENCELRNEWFAELTKAPNVIHTRAPNGRWYRNYPIETTFDGTPCIRYNVGNESYISWDERESGFNDNWDFTYVPAKSTSPRHVFFRQFSDIITPSLTLPNCLEQARFATYNDSNPDYTRMGCANAPSLYLKQYYGANSFTNYHSLVLRDTGGIYETLNKYDETPTNTSAFQKYISDQQVQLDVSGLKDKITTAYDIDTDPMQNGMRFFKQGIDMKKYYRFEHFPKQLLTLEIDPLLFTLQDGLFTYAQRFSFPQSFPNFRYASMYMINFNYAKYKQNPEFFIEAYDNTCLVMYSDLTRKVRSEMIPLLVINHKYITQSYGEIFSSKDFGIYFRTNNPNLDISSIPNKVYFYLS
jgi:hypothetical protein